MLQYTSCLFATVVCHAHFQNMSDIFCIFLSVTVMSILFHSNKNHQEMPEKTIQVIRTIDTIVAKTAYLYSTYNLIMPSLKWPIIMSILLFIIWIKVHRSTNQQELWHAIFHCVAVSSAHMYIVVSHTKASV